MWTGRAAAGLLVPSVSALDLGEIPRGGTRTVQFSLTNRGSDPVLIARVESSCRCLFVTLRNSTIKPGGKVVAVVNFDGGREPEFTGNLQMELRGVTSRGETAFVISVLAKVR